ALSNPCAVPAARNYQRRQPERSQLHQTVRANWRNFLSLVKGEGSGLPGFVRAEVERFLECGILAKGFARVRCGACGEETLAALRNVGIRGARLAFFSGSLPIVPPIRAAHGTANPQLM